MSAGRSGVWSLMLALAAGPAAAQTFEAVPDTGRITVGDPVGIRLVLRQYEGDALLEQVPRAEVTLSNGIRLLSVDSMRPIANRLMEGKARIAFYRPGAQTIPPFAIDFRRGAVILHGTMRTLPVSIDIAPVLGAGGGPRLRDIKEIVEAPGPDPRAIALAAAALMLAGWALRRRSRRVPIPVPALATMELEPDGTPDPYRSALSRLADIERVGWPNEGAVVRHYEAVADVLREYLASAEELPARERTTRELLWALPPHLSGGALRRSCAAVFEEADLVKFARRRPNASSAGEFLARARELLDGWRDAADAREVAGAVR